uniref:WD repeat-containing protein 79 n=1 Tax=Parastrongyloides trichosuri TaxID=131310 RepID=A0A0N4ZEV6_PARTI
MATTQAGIGNLLSLLKNNKTSLNISKVSTIVNVHKEVENISKVCQITMNYNLTKEPNLVETKSDCYQISGINKKSFIKYNNNYIRSVKFDGSGKYLLSSSQDRILRLFSFNENEDNKVNLIREKECGGFVYDIKWSAKDEIYAFTSFQSPIHVYDVYGECINTFKGINHLDEMDTAKSICFTNQSDYILGGYKDKIRVFNMERSGKQLYDIDTYKKYHGGQKGCFTCIRMNPSDNNIFAGATTGNNIGIYSLNDKDYQSLIGHELNGVTWMVYSPDGQYIFIGGKKNEGIICYDTRMMGIKLYDIARHSTSNQRIEFEIDSSGSYLFSGSTFGTLNVTDLRQGSSFQTTKEFNLLNTSIPSLSLHPKDSYITIGHGQRVFPYPILDEEDDNEMEENMIINNGLSVFKF